MSKQKRKPQPTTTVATSETAGELVQDVFRRALVTVRDEIAALTNGKSKPGKYTVPDRVAYLAKQASSFAAELRKAEAAERKRTEDLTVADVVAFLRAMKPRDRANLLAEVAAIEAGGSGLA
jgi:hypothetical protein